MCGVVMNHVFNYGLHIYDDFCVDASTCGGFMLWTVLELMKLLALPSVNCYVLITGYFLVSKTTLRLSGIWKVWSVTWFYAIGIYLLAVAIGAAPFGWELLRKHSTPLLSNTYWFVTSYIVLLLLAPLLSWTLQRLSLRQYQMLLVVGALACFQYPFGQMLMDRQQILLFVYLFLIGGYIRLYVRKPCRKVSIGAYCLLLLVMYAYSLLKNHPTDNTAYTIFAMDYYGLVLPLSVALFLFVKDLSIGNQHLAKAVLAVAPLSFAVYVIHTQPVVDAWLWRVVAERLTASPSWLLPMTCLAVTLLVFIVSIAIDFCRISIARLLGILYKKV